MPDPGTTTSRQSGIISAIVRRSAGAIQPSVNVAAESRHRQVRKLWAELLNSIDIGTIADGPAP